MPRVAALRSPGVTGEFAPEVRAAGDDGPRLVSSVAAGILNEHFPESYHDDLLDTGLAHAHSQDNHPSFNGSEYKYCGASVKSVRVTKQNAVLQDCKIISRLMFLQFRHENDFADIGIHLMQEPRSDRLASRLQRRICPLSNDYRLFRLTLEATADGPN